MVESDIRLWTKAVAADTIQYVFFSGAVICVCKFCDSVISVSLWRREASQATSRASTSATVLGCPHGGWQPGQTCRSGAGTGGQEERGDGTGTREPEEGGSGARRGDCLPHARHWGQTEHAASQRPRWLAGVSAAPASSPPPRPRCQQPRPPGGAEEPVRDVSAEGPWGWAGQRETRKH